MDGPLSPPVAPRRVMVIASLTRSLVNFRYDLLEAMVANGHAIHALAPDDDPETEARLAALGVAFTRIPMARASISPLGDLMTLHAIWRAIRRGRPDVVLAYTMKPILYGLLAARLAGCPGRYALVTGLGWAFGDHDAPTTRQRLTRRLAQGLSRRLYRLALHDVCRVFVYNEADRRDILRLGAPPARVTPVAGTGINLQRYPEIPLPGRGPVCLMIARLLREKGVLDFVAAARLVRQRRPELRLQLLGPLDPSPTGLGQADIDRWVAGGDVEYLGETRDVRPFLAACSVFVLPTYYREGVPRTILEAMATGRAIVTTDQSGCRETVESGVNGYLVPPRDPAALAETLLRLVQEPGALARMGTASRRIAEQRFDVRAVNAALLGWMNLDGRSPDPAAQARVGSGRTADLGHSL